MVRPSQDAVAISCEDQFGVLLDPILLKKKLSGVEEKTDKVAASAIAPKTIGSKESGTKVRQVSSLRLGSPVANLETDESSDEEIPLSTSSSTISFNDSGVSDTERASPKSLSTAASDDSLLGLVEVDRDVYLHVPETLTDESIAVAAERLLQEDETRIEIESLKDQLAAVSKKLDSIKVEEQSSSWFSKLGTVLAIGGVLYEITQIAMLVDKYMGCESGSLADVDSCEFTQAQLGIGAGMALTATVTLIQSLVSSKYKILFGCE